MPRKRGRTPRTIRSKAQFRALAAKMSRGQISKKKFDDMVRASKPFHRLPERAPSGRRSSSRGKRKRTTRRRNSSRTLLDHWKSRGGRYWVKLYANGDGSYTVQTDNSSSVRYSLEDARRAARREASYAPSKLRKANFASGMRYIRSMPPPYRSMTPRPPRNRRLNPKRRGEASSGTSNQRDVMNWMARNGGISDGKITVQTAAVRRTLEALRKKGYVRKKGYTGKNARYTLTTKGFNHLGRVQGTYSSRVSRKQKRRR